MKKLNAGLFVMCILSFLATPRMAVFAETITNDEFTGRLQQIKRQVAYYNELAVAPQAYQVKPVIQLKRWLSLKRNVTKYNH